MVGAFKVYNIFKWRCSGLFNTVFKHMQQNIQPINLLFLFLTLNLTITALVDVIVVFLSLSLKNDLQVASDHDPASSDLFKVDNGDIKAMSIMLIWCFYC